MGRDDNGLSRLEKMKWSQCVQKRSRRKKMASWVLKNGTSGSCTLGGKGSDVGLGSGSGSVRRRSQALAIVATEGGVRSAV